MKVLTAAEMREVDRLTVEAGIPESILMENAGNRVVEFLAGQFGGLRDQRVAVLCGPGNNGGDGFVIARQIFTRFPHASLYVLDASGRESEPRRMLCAAGCPISDEIDHPMRNATIVVDALLGTGSKGAARGRIAQLIGEINTGFPRARVVAVDLPSGMDSDSGQSQGGVARADYTVTFTAPKIAHVLPPNCNRIGILHVAQIGSPLSLYQEAKLHLSEPVMFQQILRPRPKDSNKGRFGHVVVVGGAGGKFGAAELTGAGALRAGAGLVTVASSADRLTMLELMTEPLPHHPTELDKILHRKDVLAIGPGLGTADDLRHLVREAVDRIEIPIVIDADGLNALAGHEWTARGRVRILTPHPGEMSRLAGLTVEEVQADRLGIARSYANEHGAILVLKGHRTIIALPDGRAWVNPVDSAAMATGGTGDVLTGIIAGLVAQHPGDALNALLAAVYLHGRAGGIGASELGEQAFIATDLLRFLPAAMAEVRAAS